MRKNVAALTVRVGIAALASLGMFAAVGAPAYAAPTQELAVVQGTFAATLTPEECSAIALKIEALDARVMALQERLGEATPSQKPAIIKMILRVEAQIAALQTQLQGCPGH